MMFLRHYQSYVKGTPHRRHYKTLFSYGQSLQRHLGADLIESICEFFPKKMSFNWDPNLKKRPSTWLHSLKGGSRFRVSNNAPIRRHGLLGKNVKRPFSCPNVTLHGQPWLSGK